MTVEGSDQASSHSEDLASTGLYVDLENLQGEGQAMVESLIEEWPATFSPALTDRALLTSR